MINYYKVGGAVRDELLGVKSKDIDFAVEASSYLAMREDILNKGMIIFQERPEFLAIRARHPQYGGVDFTLCRKEGFYSDARHPDNVEIGTIFDDLARRDFTVNAIAKTEDGRLIDPHNGKHDIIDGILRCVGNAEDRFNEDPLRILRAVRFHIVRGFFLDYSLQNLLKQDTVVNQILSLPLERVYEELRKCYAYDTWETSLFFDEYYKLKETIFKDMKLGLEPTIPFVK